MIEQGIDDGFGGVGAAIKKRLLSHGFELFGMIEKSVDFIGERGEFVAFEGDALFEEMIAVAVLLAGDGCDDNHGQAAGK